MTLEEFRKRLEVDGQLAFSVRVRPGAHATTFREVMSDGSIKIDLAAATEDGKANAELQRFLAQEFRVPLHHVQLLSGLTSRKKMVRITSL